MSTNKNSIIRLSRYRNSLNRLKTLGFVKVFSENLADAIGVSSTVVRKDFSLFGITGNKKGGYIIDELLVRLHKILGKDEEQRAIIVGMGHIGGALMQYKGFEREGMKIVAGFDIDPAKFSTAVFPLEEMADYVRKNKVQVGILAVPDSAAQHMLDLMISAGIKGVLNFAPIRLRCPENVVLNNVNLQVELENVIYFVRANERHKNGRKKTEH